MKNPQPPLNRRRWLQTASLWGMAAGVSAKGLSSLNHREREQIKQQLADVGKTLEDLSEDFGNELEEAFAYQPEGSSAPSSSSSKPPWERKAPKLPEPSPQELYPQLYRGGYAQFLNNYDFRYIRTDEVITPHNRTRRGVSNGLPPKRLWHNITESLKVADEIRHRLGAPLSYITSAYRTPAYNRQVGGASRSFHTRNNALDLVYEEGSSAAYKAALQLRKEGFFQGGVGYYSGFIHIDTRGYNATWQG